MNKCPRCKNEKTREEMKKAGVDVLKFLMNSYIEKECNDSEEEEFKKIIVGALEVAILELERTAPEVPVQEQLDSSITTKLGNSKVVIEKDGITIEAAEIIIQNQ